jgi:CheY-like chemotaxis protein
MRDHFPDADEAIDGEEAITKINEKKYDIILVDLRLPKRSGYDVLEEIAKTNNGLPIVLSGFVEEEDVKKCGAVCVVDKLDTFSVVRMIKEVY